MTTVIKLIQTRRILWEESECLSINVLLICSRRNNGKFEKCTESHEPRGSLSLHHDIMISKWYKMNIYRLRMYLNGLTLTRTRIFIYKIDHRWLDIIISLIYYRIQNIFKDYWCAFNIQILRIDWRHPSLIRQHFQWKTRIWGMKIVSTKTQTRYAPEMGFWSIGGG